ncbi:MAG: hypothetical protein GWN67_19230 [Phycisphaerae bacterium]|nr:hypothetical protein [Phycisphaerae bacterium]NIP54322.1 hypothetical protein [Phycisphaerae bacterium]NIS53191.1 hypothetical protein [Phycisphaerae bacterium]NIU10676.1 hypothetical protein [Phycisphaerae bacterium]NIU58437.1 hypothetical protein [Phycisphaerae bacterium]
MNDIYWYISDAKVEKLQHVATSFLAKVAAELSFKFPLFEGKLSGASDSSLVSDVKRISERLVQDEKVESFDVLGGGDTPRLISFSGAGGRYVDKNAFWLVLKGERNALLLAGSPAHAVGREPTADTYVSPSVDPVSALRAAFDGDPSFHGHSLSASLSYAWQEIARGSLLSEGGVPRVEGLAFFARSVPTDQRQLRRVGCSNLENLVIGSPLYVRQV